jgi:hypothetical protein
MFKKYQYLTIMLIAVILLQGCSKDYFDLNTNPNQVDKPTLGTLLTTATHKTGINSYNVGSLTSVYVQYLANPSASASSDIYQVVDYTGTWDALYYAMADINDLKALAQEQGSSEYVGVADVLLSYHLTLVSDLWGSAPFSDAFFTSTKTLTPKYDSHEQLYNTAMSLLDEAITELAKTDATIKLAAASDLIHAGARDKWLKTAYALKARMLIKVSKKASYSPTAVLAAVDNSYKSNADDAGMAAFQLRNSWAQVARNNAALTLSGWLSEQLVDHLNGVTYGVFDPRIRKITDPTVNGTFIGTVNGAGNRPPGNNTVKDENYVSISSPWTADLAPILIMTYAELKFIEAEAALAAGLPTRAYAAYLAGINANMDKLQVPAGAEKTDYMTAASVGEAGLTRDLIFKEKYVATYLNPEAWNDARRYDYAYKNFTLPQNAVLSTFIRRLEYPTGERSKNGPNIPAVSGLDQKLWWDQ